MKHKWVYPVCSQCGLLVIQVTEKNFPFQLRGEYVASSEAVKEVMFVVKVLGSINWLDIQSW